MWAKTTLRSSRNFSSNVTLGERAHTAERTPHGYTVNRSTTGKGMPKPRLFISHSARGEPETMGLLDDLRKALENSFAVLIDKDDIEVGDSWRQTLNTWIGGCDAAIVLLTEKALQSEYVAYEVTVLTYREKNLPAHKCTVIPVFVDPVNDEAVRKTRGFRPSLIAEYQGISAKTRQEIVQKVEKALTGLPLLPSPIEEQEVYIENLLRKLVPQGKVSQSLDMLNVDLGGWKADPFRSLALALLSRGLDDLTANVILGIRSYIKDRETLETLFEIIATSWIDVRSTECLAQIACNSLKPRLVALNAASDFIARKYVERAGNRPPGDSWSMAPVTAVFSEAAVESLRREIERSIRSEIRLGPGENLADYLQWSERRKQPIFVALPAAGITTAILDQLRASFPTVTFLLLAGVEMPVLNAIEQQNIQMLEPRLHPNFEPAFIKTYQDERLGLVETYLRKHGL